MQGSRTVVEITAAGRARLNADILGALDNGWRIGRAHSIIQALVFSHHEPASLLPDNVARAAADALLTGGSCAWTKRAAAALHLPEYTEQQRAWLLARTLDGLYQQTDQTFPA